MSYHAGLNAARVPPRESQEQPENGRHKGPTPIGKETMKAEMRAPEDEGRYDHCRNPVARPAFQPLLQEAPKEELLGERHHPQDDQKGSDRLQNVQWMGA